jgi:ribosomal protein S4
MLKKHVEGYWLNLIQLLEMRLDTLCFALGFAKTIAQATTSKSWSYYYQ